MFFHMVYNLDRSFYRFVTIHACDRRTEFSSLGKNSNVAFQTVFAIMNDTVIKVFFSLWTSNINFAWWM